MTPTQLADLIKSSDTLLIREEPAFTSLRLRLGNDANRNNWFEIANSIPDYLSNISILYADGDEPYDGTSLPSATDEFRIILEKIQIENQLLLFLQSSTKMNLRKLADFDIVRVADLSEEEGFQTYRNIYQPWTEEQATDFTPTPLFPDPRQYVSDFSNEHLVPADIRPWIIRELPKVLEGFYERFHELASKPLLASICDRVSSNDGEVHYHFAGPPVCSFQIEDEKLWNISERLMDCARWVYTHEPRDADARHLLLANELARSFRKSSLNEFGLNSLEAAVAAYQAYIKSQSKDTLKALSDLRKIVLEETQSISNRANEFAKSMWKDLAVAAAPFVVKILSDAAKEQNETISMGLAYGAALFLSLSISIQIYLNERWISQQAFARGIWKLEINTALTEAELNEVSEIPVAKAIKDFRRVKWLVLAFYSFLILLLINYASSGLIVDLFQLVFTTVLILCCAPILS